MAKPQRVKRRTSHTENVAKSSPPTKRKRSFTRFGVKLLVAGLATSLLSFLAFPSKIVESPLYGACALISMVPTLLLIRNATPLKALGIGLCLGTFFYGAAIGFVVTVLNTFGDVSFITSVLLTSMLVMVVCASHWAVALGLVAFFKRSLNWPLWITVPPAWITLEWLRSFTFGGFPWADIGVTQIQNSWLTQVASLGGVYAIIFLVVWINSVVVELWVWKVNGQRPFPKRLVISTVILLISAHGYGAVRRHLWQDDLKQSDRARIAVVQSNYDPRADKADPTFALRVLESHHAETHRRDRDNAALIVWPESAYPSYFPTKIERFDQNFIPGASLQSKLLFGLTLQEGEKSAARFFNTALLLSPTFEIEARYVKHHLTPYGEYMPFGLARFGFKPLSGEEVVEGAGELIRAQLRVRDRDRDVERDVHLGALICYETLYPSASLRHARQGAEILALITNDSWLGSTTGTYQFFHTARLRAIETGLSIVRSARTGVSAFIDPLGNIEQSIDVGLVSTTNARVDRTLLHKPESIIADVPLLKSATLYAVIGNSLAYLSALFCLLGVVLGVRSSVRKRQGENP